MKKLGSSISIHWLYHFPPDSIDYVYALDNFDYFNIEGEAKTLNRYASDINFQIKEDEYSVKFGIIPKVTGKYGVSISDSGPAVLPGNERCDTGGFEFVNGNTDNHVELIEEYSGAENVSDLEKESVQKSVAHLDSTIDNQLFIKGVPHLTEHSLEKTHVYYFEVIP